MSLVFPVVILALLCLLALTAYIDRIYAETGKFLSRDSVSNVEIWERFVEPRLRLGAESAALSASVLRQFALAALSFLLARRLYQHAGDTAEHVLRTVFELFLALLLFDRVLPQLLFTRTSGRWIGRLTPLVQTLFFLVLPLTLLIGLLLSIVGLAGPEPTEPEHPGEAMDALLEAGEEEGILEESDRELVRNVVEFGDKVVREVMTPRPEIFAVPGTMTLADFTAAVNEHNVSRVPVFVDTLDNVTGIAFARDLLHIHDVEASRRTVTQMQRPAAFCPETKKVNELLRDMQRQKQHMNVVIDEYGAVAGLVTIEDLLEAIVGNIEDEHDTAEAEDAPLAEPGGAFVVPGSFDVSRLRDLFAPSAEDSDDGYAPEEDAYDAEPTAEQRLGALLNGYEASTIGGLVSEMAGHIPLPGEVIEDGPLRLEVIASTDRRVDRVRVLLASAGAFSEAE